MTTLSRRSLLAGSAAFGLLAVGARAQSPRFSLRGSAWATAGRMARLDPYLLYAVGWVESRHRRGDREGPWPYAIRAPEQSHYPDDFKAAVKLLDTLPEESVTESDLGWMQVNVRWHGHRVPVLAHLLNPNINLRIGAGILREAIDSSPRDPELAVGRYHTWLDEQRARDYARKVLSVRDALRRYAGEPPAERLS